jgi:hypothetical protein
LLLVSFVRLPGFRFGSGSDPDTETAFGMAMIPAEHCMRTWRKLYFGLALLSAAFLLESFLPVTLF